MSVNSLSEPKRKRGRPRKVPEADPARANAYGIQVPLFAESEERFLSPNDIGKILNVTGEAVKQWIYRRKIPAVKLANGYWKVKVADFETFLRSRTETSRKQIIITDVGNSGSWEILESIENLGHQGVLANNYPDALLKALDHFPALFIVCISPNDPAAWKFTENVRKNKDLRKFPILIIGGASISELDTERSVQCYAQGILTRPLSVEVVQREIERILQRTF